MTACYGIHDQIVVLTAQAGGMLIHGRTGTLYFYNEDVEWFGNANAEAFLSFWGEESPHLVPVVTPPWLLADGSAYPSTATQRRWFLRPEAMQ